jgi:hypothetical protein
MQCACRLEMKPSGKACRNSFLGTEKLQSTF